MQRRWRQDATAILPKPFSPRVILAKVREFLT
jgi:hypothetical protein